MPWIIYAVLAVALVAALVWPLTKPDKLVDQFARKVNLAIDPGNAARIRQRVIGRQRATAGATAAGTVVLLIALLLVPDVATSPFLGMIVIAVLALATAVGVGIAAMTEAATQPEDAVRVARIPSSRVDDYVAGLERWGGRIVASLAGVVGLGLAAINLANVAWTTDAIAPAALGGLSLVLLATVELTGIRVVARPQPASNPTDLAWDDALRSSVLRDLYRSVIAVGSAALVITLVLPAPGESELLEAALPFAVLPLFAAMLVLVVVSLASGPQLHYQRRLWPEVAS